MNCFNSSDYLLPADYCLSLLRILIAWTPLPCWRALLLQCAVGLLHFTEISVVSRKKGCYIVDSAFEEVYLGCVIWKGFFSFFFPKGANFCLGSKTIDQTLGTLQCRGSFLHFFKHIHGVAFFAKKTYRFKPFYSIHV